MIDLDTDTHAATHAATSEAAALAAAAGVADLAAALEIEAAEGEELQAMLARHEIAVGHRLTMQFAAAGNAALDAAEWGRLKNLVRHEVAAAHRLVMRFGGRAGRLLAQAPANDDRLDALRLASAAARLMARGRQALATLPRLAPGPDGGPGRIVGYYWVGEHDLFASRMTDDGAQKLPANDIRPAARALRPPSSVVCRLNRGRLKNGNPSGDYMAAPRCGAATRAGCGCRQPAMANGRCRFHGGKSTGPRTAAGLARSRAARRTHGGYTAEIIDLRRAAAAHARRVKALAAHFPRGGAAAHFSRPREAGEGQGGGVRIELVVPAGHGVDPLFLMARPRRRRSG